MGKPLRHLITEKTKDVVVTAPGSLGDVNPMLKIARRLHVAGCNVTFLAAERYLHLAERAGLSCRSLVAEEEFKTLAGNASLWHPRRGVRLIFERAVGDFLVKHYRWLEQNFAPESTVLISHILDFAGRVFRDKYPSCHLATVLPAPALIRSMLDPPRLSSYFWEPILPRWTLPFLYRAADVYVDSFALPAINRLREEIGLEPVRRLLDQWCWSPDRVLGCFPTWFSVPEQERMPQLLHLGFPLADSEDVVRDEQKEKLAAVLQQFSGRKPIVFAPGTAHEHAKYFLTCAANACDGTGRCGILISSKADQVPQDQLGDSLVTADYLPFSRLLPHCSAIVHHGGVGTTSQALAAGIPQVVLPMAFDQFDNAKRVQKLGCGVSLPMRKISTAKLTGLLDRASQLDVQALQNASDAVRSDTDFGDQLLHALGLSQS